MYFELLLGICNLPFYAYEITIPSARFSTHTTTFGTYTFLTVWSFVIAVLAAVFIYKDKKLKKYADGIILLGVFISVVFWFNGQVMLLDVALDTSETTHYSGRVSDKVYSSKIIPSYSVFIDFESTAKSEPLTGAVQVNEKQYNEYDKGDVVYVAVRDGFLGIRYFEVEKVDPVEKSEH